MSHRRRTASRTLQPPIAQRDIKVEVANCVGATSSANRENRNSTRSRAMQVRGGMRPASPVEPLVQRGHLLPLHHLQPRRERAPFPNGAAQDVGHLVGPSAEDRVSSIACQCAIQASSAMIIFGSPCNRILALPFWVISCQFSTWGPCLGTVSPRSFSSAASPARGECC